MELQTLIINVNANVALHVKKAHTHRKKVKAIVVIKLLG